MSFEIKEGRDILGDIISRINNPGFKVSTVGIHGDVDSEVVSYAIKNEFGAGRIPARPFIRQTFDKNKEELILIGNKLFAQLRDGNIGQDEALFAWGESLQAMIQNEINEGTNFIANAPSTLKAKEGNKNPLQDQGRLQESIKTVVS